MRSVKTAPCSQARANSGMSAPDVAEEELLDMVRSDMDLSVRLGLSTDEVRATVHWRAAVQARGRLSALGYRVYCFGFREQPCRFRV